jgi:cytochrome c-type biogenesis protein
MENITLLGMFTLGIITSLSPCSIAILISMISFIIGESKSVLQGLILSLSFSLGLSLVFLVFGIFVSYLGSFVRYSHMFFAIAGLVLIYFGLKQLGVAIKLPRIKKGNSVSVFQTIGVKLIGLNYVLASFLFGILFALGWAPCATSLIMPVIVYIMAKETTLLNGGLLLFVFGLGHSVPIIPIAILGEEIKQKLQTKMIKTGNVVTKIISIVMIFLGMILLFFGPKLSSIGAIK